MIKAIIVDDEERSRKNLAVLLTDFCTGVEVVALARSVREATEAVKEFQPDVVFLDIQMQGETGFDLLSELDKVDFEVVFATAHAEHAINPIRFAAVEYLLKPIDIGDLKQTLVNITAKKRGAQEIKNQIDTLLHNIRVSQPEEYILGIPSEEMCFAPVKDVLYCEANNGTTKIHLKNGQICQVSRSMKEYDNLLTQFGFFRIDQSFLVNIREIKQFHDSAAAHIVMNNNVQIPVWERKKAAFLKVIEGTTIARQ